MRKALFVFAALLASFCALGREGVALGTGHLVVYAAKMTIYPGDAITEDMLAERPLAQVSGAGGYVTDKDQVIGKFAKHTLIAGQPIAKTSLREPYAVQQNKVTPIVFQSGGLIITGVAVALESGAVGDFISARNQESGFVIKGQVQPDGSLRVDAP